MRARELGCLILRHAFGGLGAFAPGTGENLLAPSSEVEDSSRSPFEVGLFCFLDLARLMNLLASSSEVRDLS